MEYVAFISYSRKDKTIADWLHRKLEHYKVPEAILSTTPIKLKGNYIRKVFIDRQDLHVEERPFTDGIKEALCDSQFLIVICSKNSAISEFVDKEIKYFLQVHENNYSKVIPIFIDEVDRAIPPAFIGTTIMNRHFPIYNSKLSRDSEANMYCLYQVISYTLGADFADIYNRYEIEIKKNAKSRNRRSAIIIGICIMVTLIMGIYHYSYHIKEKEIISQQRRIIEVEKRVFPAAVVHGYERNFLTPVIRYLKGKGERFTIHILMPTNERDLTHHGRVTDIAYDTKMRYGVDSIVNVSLPTETRRGSRVMRLAYDGAYVDGVYIDFATTTTSFLDVAKYKRRHTEYQTIPLDDIIAEYTQEFIRKTNEELRGDSTFVKFYTDREQFIQAICTNLQHK